MTTLAQAQAMLDALLAQPPGSIGSVSIGGRTVSYRSLGELTDAIVFWERRVATLTARAAGKRGPSFLAADFRSRQ
jgi:hypothetical protein